MNKPIPIPVGADVSRTIADYGFSKNTLDVESGPSLVTLSRSEGSVALGHEMLRCGSG